MKPITVAREEFVASLVDLCNNSGLPFFVLEGILKDTLSEVHSAAVKQYEADLKKYNDEKEAAEGAASS